MHFDTSTRQRWMAVLAHSQPAALQSHMQSLGLTPEYECIRAPETGLVQIQARMGGTGQRFFAGDATLTRTVVRLATHAGSQAVPDALLGDGAAVSVNYAWTGRYFDNLQLPKRGHGQGLDLGLGLTTIRTRPMYSPTTAVPRHSSRIACSSRC